MPEQTENRNEFEPDREFETHFPWEDVVACLNNKLESGKFTDHRHCGKCGLESEKTNLDKFQQPGLDLGTLVRPGGPLSICPKCKIQVEFILEVIN